MYRVAFRTLSNNYDAAFFRSRCPEQFCKNGALRNFANITGKHLCQSLFFNKVAGLRSRACNFIKKETLAQVFSCEFCKISKNTFSYRTPLVGASVFYNISSLFLNLKLFLMIQLQPWDNCHDDAIPFHFFYD